MVKDLNVSALIEDTIRCVEQSTTLPLNHDILNKVYLHHKLLTLYGLAQKIPPEMRQHLYIYTLPNINPILPFTELEPDCLNKIKLLATIALAAAVRTDHPRVKIVLARIGSILSRSITRNGIYIAKDNLIGILHELDIAITTALASVTQI
mgnify:CR=1 FL=1